jgi:hypothetical protein
MPDRRAGVQWERAADFNREAHPDSSSHPTELKRSRYRQIVEPPCRVLYRYDDETVFVLFLMRIEQLLRKGVLQPRE